MIDLHCHLDLYPNPYEVVEQCKNHNLYVLSVTTTPKAWNGTKALAEKYKKIQTALGLHPQLAHERYNELELFDSLITEAKYVGEIGLDGSKSYRSHFEDQTKVFRHILNTVQVSGGRTMTIHSRGSASAVLDNLLSFPDSGISVLHWFTGNKTELRRAISQNCWFSVNPTMLSTKRGQNLVMDMPKDRVLPETDGPFAKLNRKALMPWDAKLVPQLLSKIWRVDVLSIESLLIENFQRLVDVS